MLKSGWLFVGEGMCVGSGLASSQGWTERAERWSCDCLRNESKLEGMRERERERREGVVRLMEEREAS